VPKNPSRPKPPLLIKPRGVPAPASGGEYEYFEQFEGSPPYLSNCEPIPVVIRDKVGPADGPNIIVQSLQQIADASGISFKFVEYTNEVYSFNQRPERFPWEQGDRSIWLGWASQNEVPDLGPAIPDQGVPVGLGGPGALFPRGNQVEMKGGGAVFRAEYVLNDKWGKVVLHEVGHVLGLSHVNSRAEQMYPAVHDLEVLGAGDKEGLQKITKACSPN
jgi:hypothetical protein